MANPPAYVEAEKSTHCACTDTVSTNPALINVSSVTPGEIFQLSSKLLFIIPIKNRLAEPLPISTSAQVQKCSSTPGLGKDKNPLQ